MLTLTMGLRLQTCAFSAIKLKKSREGREEWNVARIEQGLIQRLLTSEQATNHQERSRRRWKRSLP